MSKTIKVGDEVSWRGSFGNDEPKTVKVMSLETTVYPREKYGEDVNEVTWDLVKKNRVNFGLSSGNWAYSEQVAPVGQDPNRYHGLRQVSRNEFKDLFAIMNGTKQPY